MPYNTNAYKQKHDLQILTWKCIDDPVVITKD
jgi:hypothetical protein